MKKILKKKGFTLIELIVVITILGILVAIAVPSILGNISTATTNVDKANTRTAKSEIALKYATDATAPTSPYTFVAEGITYECQWTGGSALTGFACSRK